MERILLLHNSPYLVEPAEKPKQALVYALERGLLERFSFDQNRIKEYLADQESLPIYYIEAACAINYDDARISIQYQIIWFCLHSVRIIRNQPSGRIFRPRVQFPAVYTKGKDLLLLLNKASMGLDEAKESKQKAREKFVELSGFRKKAKLFYNWRYQNSFPITAVLKACQILNLEWKKVIDKHDLFGKSQRKGKILFKFEEENVTLNYIINWINTDGHIEAGSTHITIDQKFVAFDRLLKLQKAIIRYFHLSKTSTGFYEANAWGGVVLYVSSAPLRTILVLCYNLNPGYKCGSIEKPKIDITKLSVREKYHLLSAFCESEGSFSNGINHGKWLSPRFEFKAKDSNLVIQVKDLLESLSYTISPIGMSKGLFTVGVYDLNGFFRLCDNLKRFLSNSTNDTIRKIMGELKRNNIVLRIRIKNEMLKRKIRVLRDINGTNRSVAQIINKRFGTNYSLFDISYWINSAQSIPLAVAFFLCDNFRLSSKQYIPIYYHQLYAETS